MIYVCLVVHIHSSFRLLLKWTLNEQTIRTYEQRFAIVLFVSVCARTCVRMYVLYFAHIDNNNVCCMHPHTRTYTTIFNRFSCTKFFTNRRIFLRIFNTYMKGFSVILCVQPCCWAIACIGSMYAFACLLVCLDVYTCV